MEDIEKYSEVRTFYNVFFKRGAKAYKSKQK